MDQWLVSSNISKKHKKIWKNEHNKEYETGRDEQKQGTETKWETADWEWWSETDEDPSNYMNIVQYIECRDVNKLYCIVFGDGELFMEAWSWTNGREKKKKSYTLTSTHTSYSHTHHAWIGISRLWVIFIFCVLFIWKMELESKNNCVLLKMIICFMVKSKINLSISNDCFCFIHFTNSFAPPPFHSLIP